MAELKKVPFITNVSIENPLNIINSWKNIKGDKIKNQGIANTLFGNTNFFVGKILNEFGCLSKYEETKKSLNDGLFDLVLTDSQIDCINKLEDEGKSRLLFEKLYLVKDSKYWVNLPFVLKKSEKIGIGVGVLFLGYVTYKLIKR